MYYNVDLPHFKGDEKEQLAQMRNYLYRQAEHLGYALNNLDSVSGNYVAPKNTLNTSEIMKRFGDYVTANGASDGWNYKKWHTETYEMYGSFAVKPASSDKGENFYITNDIVIPTPFDISEDAVVTGSVEGNRWLADCRFAATRAVSVKIMSDSEISTAEPVVIHLHVIGVLGSASQSATFSLRRNAGAYVINTEE